MADGFYHYQDTSKVENRCDFILQKRSKQTDDFVFIPISDPQAKNEAQLDRFRKETVPDLIHTADSLKSLEVVGMGCYGFICSLPENCIQLGIDYVSGYG